MIKSRYFELNYKIAVNKPSLKGKVAQLAVTEGFGLLPCGEGVEQSKTDEGLIKNNHPH